MFKHYGKCPICEAVTTFASKNRVLGLRDKNGEIRYHHAPEYHGNPVDSKGSLMTMHWGYDIAEFIFNAAKTPTILVMIDNIDLGIRAEYIEVMVSRKPGIL